MDFLTGLKIDLKNAVAMMSSCERLGALRLGFLGIVGRDECSADVVMALYE